MKSLFHLGAKKRRQPAYDPWDLSAPLLEWADDVPWRVGSAAMGTMIFGSTGSGKSTGSLAAICNAQLRAGFGGLFLTTKLEDRDTYIKYVRDAGRMDDLLIFSPDNWLRYNFIAEERAQSKDGIALVENLTALLMAVTELGERSGSGGSSGGDSERFFRLEATRLARNGLLALVLSRDVITIPDLHKLITSAAVSLEQVTSESWQQGSFCFACLRAADDAPKSESMRADFDLALTYFLNEWPALSARTRSVVQSTLTSSTDLLSRGAARDMLSSPTSNISPTDCYEGAIIIADFPVLLYHDIGQLIQVILKFAWQRAHARRDISVNHRPTFIVADEAQMLLVDADQQFQAISRSTRTAVVYATQSISGMIDAMGGTGAEPKVHALLGNLQTRICHQQSDIRTVQYMQELIGHSRQLMMTGNQSHEADWLAPLMGQTSGGSAGFSETFEHEIHAADLHSLAKGGPPHWMTEALVYEGGRRFLGGKRWLRAGFPQRR